MPPIPGQGQNVLTVDELERRQQVLTNWTDGRDDIHINADLETSLGMDSLGMFTSH
jgi:acyl carrier protein